MTDNVVHGEGGIRTPDRGITPYNGLANRRLQPLGHLSNFAAPKLSDDGGPELAGPHLDHSTRVIRPVPHCGFLAAAESDFDDVGEWDLLETAHVAPARRVHVQLHVACARILNARNPAAAQPLRPELAHDVVPRTIPRT